MSAAQDNARRAGLLFAALAAGGVEHVVTSPGSRSTPLVLAADATTGLRVHVVLDERVAAFFALGLARAARGPVALVCTSGSAGAHWLPAVVEAAQSRVPLVLITADRPVELQGCGAPQTIDQRGLFQGFLRLDASLGEDSPSGDWIGGLAARLLDAATGSNPGPVRLNAPFREPLWDPAAQPSASPPFAPRVVRGPPVLDDDTLDALAERVGAVENGLIVVGPRESAWEGSRWGKAGGRFPEAVFALAERLGWPVLADAAGGARFGAPNALRVGAFDAILRDEAAREALRPDGVLRFGQLPTSKPLFTWLGQVGRGRTVLVDPTGAWHDPDHTATLLLAAEPTALCEALTRRLKPRAPGPSAQRWQRAEAAARGALAEATAAGLWGGSIAAALARALPADATVQVASSMAVRDFDTFAAADSPLAARVNRGANGIDGTLSTALGMAQLRAPVVALCGDLALQHDLGALAMAKTAGTFVAVVVDNGGGGIFGFLPIAAHPTAFERLFLTPQGLDPVALARGFGLEARRCDDLARFEQELAQALTRPGFTLLHLPIDREADLAQHRQTWTRVREALARV